MTTTAILLVLAAAALLLLEMAIPSFGLFGLLSATAYTFSLVIGFRESRELGIQVVVLGLLSAPFAFFFGLRLMRKTKLGRATFLSPPTDAELGRVPDVALRQLVGRSGTVATDLRPVGRIDVDGTRLDAAAALGFIEKGARIRVVGVDGGRIIVEASSALPATEE